MMSGRWQDEFEMEYYQTRRSTRGRDLYSAPGSKYLKSAENIARYYQEKGRASAALHREPRIASAALSLSVTDNIVQFRQPVAAAPSSTLRAQPHWTLHRLSSAPRARRAARQSESRRAARYSRATPSPLAALNAAVFDDLHNDMWRGFGLLAVQALAVVWGLSGVLALLTLV